MTRDRSVDERISAWLREEAPNQLPDRVLRATFERTRPMLQRRTFLGWRFPSMYRFSPTVIAVGATAIIVLALGVALYPRPSGLGGGGSTATPRATPTATPAATPSAVPSPTLTPITLGGEIAFERTVDSNTDIYVMNLDRSRLRRLTSDPAPDAAPSWSFDGTRILFTRGSGSARDVYVMNADGSGQTRLTTSAEGEDSAAFSPDGSKIVFLRYVDPTYFDIYVMDADGSNEHLLWHKDGVWVAGPRWAPDGKAIFFNEDESSGGNIDIVRLDVATGAVTPIEGGPGDDSSFAISPDSSTIAFQSDRASGGLFLADIDGSNVRHLTGSWTKGYPISWSSDGKHLVYADPDGWLYLVQADGSEVSKWTKGDYGIAWNPAL